MTSSSEILLAFFEGCASAMQRYELCSAIEEQIYQEPDPQRWPTWGEVLFAVDHSTLPHTSIEDWDRKFMAELRRLMIDNSPPLV